MELDRDQSKSEADSWLYKNKVNALKLGQNRLCRTGRRIVLRNNGKIIIFRTSD